MIKIKKLLVNCDYLREIGKKYKSVSYALLYTNPEQKPVWFWEDQLGVLTVLKELFEETNSASLPIFLDRISKTWVRGIGTKPRMRDALVQYYFLNLHYGVPIIPSVLKGMQRLEGVVLSPAEFPLNPNTLIQKGPMYESVLVDFRPVPKHEGLTLDKTEYSNGVACWVPTARRNLDTKCELV